MSDLKTTRMRDMKPKLVWIGKLLGMDIYMDVGGQMDPDRKLDLAEACLKKAFGVDPVNSFKRLSEEAFVANRLQEYQQYWNPIEQRYIIDDWQPTHAELLESIEQSYQFEYGGQ